MARSPKANVSPQLLTWARESIGMSRDKAASRLHVKPERIASWELGTDKPSIIQLRALANAYKRPLAVFFLPEPPESFDTLRDFRRLPEAKRSISPELHAEIRRGHTQRDTYLELSDELGEDLSEFPTLSLPEEEPDAAAAIVRRFIGVALSEQFSWTDPYQALNAWISAIEDRGALVLQTSRVEVSEARGFSISERLVPVIALNGSDAIRGKVFTLLHETAHVLINVGGLCDLHDRRVGQTWDIEVFCNQVAASALVPASAFRREELVQRGLQDEAWSDPLLSVLSRRYSVSQEVILRRLLTLELIGQDFYNAKRQEYLEAYERARAEASGAPQYHIVRVRNLGRSYVRTVLEAYQQNAINTTDVSEFLGVRIKHLPKIEEAVAGR